MATLILRRLMTVVPTLLVVIALSFLLMRLAPGGPFDGERPFDPETRRALMARFGLDQPPLVQFLLYLRGLCRGDFGPSLVYRDFTVADLVAAGLPVSLTLGGLALVLALGTGMGLGIVAARRPGAALDRLVAGLGVLLNAVPGFVTAPLLVLVFSFWLEVLPASGWQPERPATLVLPVVALALPVTGAIARLTRAGLTDVMASDFIRTARARGLSEGRILIRHALKPALLPVASYVGPAAAGLLTGTVVIETVFGLPGLGRYFVQGALNRDYPLVLAVVLLYAALILLFNLVADVLYGWLDPRIRA